MGPLRRCAVPLVLLLAAACGDAGAGPEPGRVLAAAGASGEEAPVFTAPPIPPVLPSITTIATTTTTRRPAPVPTTTTSTAVPRTSTTRAPSGVTEDGLGGLAEATVAGVKLEMSAYPLERYFGEDVHVGASVIHPPGTAITSLKLDLGNGHVVTGQPSTGWYCEATGNAGISDWYVYPAPGTYKITATFTFVACQGIPGMYVGPHFPRPEGLVGPWFPEPHQSATAAINVTTRPDRRPLPVGTVPGP
jgi:hypothetical protein